MASHPHLLQVCDQPNWVCDQCKQLSGESETGLRYRCAEGCDFDLCAVCFVAHHPHGLTLNKEPNRPLICNFCSKQEVIGYSCEVGCEMDMCRACFTRNHPHRFFQQTFENRSYKCRVCEHQFPVLKKGVYWKCGPGNGQCDQSPMEICSHCWKKKNALHPHYFVTANESGHQCDQCGSVLNGNYYKCGIGCEYDLCERCFSQTKARKSAAEWIYPPDKIYRQRLAAAEEAKNKSKSQTNVPGQSQPPPALPQPPNSVPVDDNSRTECMVCMERQKNALFFPCKHLVCCVECANKWVDDKGTCIVCNSHVHEIISIFVS